MTYKWIYVAVLALAVWTPSTWAASFDCQSAETTTEKAICEHRVLNDADVKLVHTYDIIRRLVPMGTRSVIQREQVKWLQLRDQCHANLECLLNMYQMRQQKLETYMERVYQQGPF